ncbi:MAG: type I restriction endonuclease subunit R, partial [Gemmatimonadaceae bacterium]
GLGYLVKTVTFDSKTLEGLRREPGSDEGKVFNLIRGLNKEIDSDPDMAPVLMTLKERSERIIKDLEDRTTTGLAAMDRLAALAAERDAAVRAAKDTGLSTRAFGVYWRLKDDPALLAAKIDPKALAVEAEGLVTRFPNARVNPDERRQLRAALYRPLLGLDGGERGRVVDAILIVLLNDAEDRD